jgi:hypothetical protein
MQKLTIIPVDHAVYVDGISHSPLDLSSCGIPEHVHALQWFGSSGWVEFSDRRDNQELTELPSWAALCVEKWQLQDAEERAQLLLNPAEGDV